MAPMKAMKVMKTMKASKKGKALTKKTTKNATKDMKAMKLMNYEVIILCCHACGQAKEIVGSDGRGKLTFREYYCPGCGGPLEIVSVPVKPS
jgi:uncharacterized protein YbbK (DUF523 family)